MPQKLKISGIADDGTIMGVRHKQYPVEGLQFHPRIHQNEAPWNANFKELFGVIE